MKKAIFIFLLFQLFNEINAQNIVWVKQTNAQITGNAIDKLGNTYIAGHYLDSARFEDTVIYATGQQWQNYSNIFLAKYTPTGKLKYVLHNTGTGIINMTALHMDNMSNLYMIGEYENQITFGNFTINGDPGIISHFLVKYDSLGNVIWLKDFPSLYINGNNYLILKDITTDDNGQIFIYGYCGMSTVLDGIPINLVSPIASELFIAKLNPITSNAIWVKQIRPQYGYGWPDKIIAVGNNVIISGSYGETLTSNHIIFNNIDTMFKDPSIYRSTFLAHYDSVGNYNWSIQIDSFITNDPRGLIADQNQHIFILINGKLAKYDMTGQQIWINTNSYYSADRFCSNNNSIFLNVNFQDTLIYNNLTILDSGYHEILLKTDTINSNVIWHTEPTNSFSYHSCLDATNTGLISYSRPMNKEFKWGQNNIYKGEEFYSVHALIADSTYTPLANNQIKGNIYNDLNTNCINNAEPALNQFIVMAEPGPYFAATDSLGNYTLKIDSGIYTVQEIIPISHAFTDTIVCPLNNYTVTANNINQTFSGYDFANNYNPCYLLSVNTWNDFPNICNSTKNNYVKITNHGNDTAYSLVLKIKYPGEVMFPQSSIPAWTSYIPNDSMVTFNISQLAPNSSLNITILDSIICNTPNWWYEYNYYLNLTPLNLCYEEDSIHNSTKFSNYFFLPFSTTNLSNEEIKIFPNPTTSTFMITGIHNISEIEIYNILGQKIMQKKNETHSPSIEINLNEKQNGIYFIKLKNGNFYSTFKVLKQ